MTDIYAIGTSVGTAGLAVRDTAGFRFYASDQVFMALESRRYERLAEICTARADFTDTRRSKALVVALYGAVWYRLLLDEPLDDGFISGMIKLARYSDRGLALAME
jgi:hypothetical protein